MPRTSLFLMAGALLPLMAACGQANPLPQAPAASSSSSAPVAEASPSSSPVGPGDPHGMKTVSFCDADVLVTLPAEASPFVTIAAKAQEPLCGDGSKQYEAFRAWTPSERQPSGAYIVERRCEGAALVYRLQPVDEKTPTKVPTTRVDRAITCL